MNQQTISYIIFFERGVGGEGGFLNSSTLPTSSMSSTLSGVPTSSFHTHGARCRSSGFLVLIATPNNIPRNLNMLQWSSVFKLGFSTYLSKKERKNNASRSVMFTYLYYTVELSNYQSRLNSFTRFVKKF